MAPEPMPRPGTAVRGMGANAADAGVTVFFYGLYMDAALLERKHSAASPPRRARLDGYRIVIEARATLVPANAAAVYGLVMQVPADDLERLYADPAVLDYRARPVRVTVDPDTALEAVCYIAPLVGGARSERYVLELERLATRLQLPGEYRAALRIAAPGGAAP